MGLEVAAVEIQPREFVDAMTLPVWQAMAVARWMEGRVRNRPKRHEVTPEKAALTDADCVAQEVLLVALRERFPRAALDVEEDTPSVADFDTDASGSTVVIDPIDGTLRYLRGDGPYAVIVGLEHAGRAMAALIGLPQEGILVRAVRGAGAEISTLQRGFVPARAAETGARVLASYGLPPEVRERLESSGLRLVTAAGAAIGIAPLVRGVCGGIRIMAGPQGLSRRAWISLLPTLEAGGCVEGLDGELPPRYEPGIRGLVTATSVAGLARLRDAGSRAA